MIKTNFFQKYFLLASALLIFFILLGIGFSSLIFKVIDQGNKFPPPIYFAQILDRLNEKDKISVLNEISNSQDSFPLPQIVLFNERGDVLFPKEHNRIENWDTILKPTNPFEFVYLNTPKKPFLGPPSPMEMPNALVRLSGEPANYLLIGPPQRPPGAKNFRLFPLIGLGSLVLSLLLGVGTAVAFIYYKMRKGVAEADEVIAELHKGNLKARFQIDRKDEFGQAMQRFNFMADEIEKLVLNLKDTDRARTQLLQELAHDLRTPIASLKSLLETLESKRQSLDITVQNEITALALKEIDYFAKLVEDLLFLAQVREPIYQVNVPSLNISELLLEEADSCILRHQSQGNKIELNHELNDAKFNIRCDQHLIKRLFRNALENALSFAKSKVSLSISRINGTSVKIVIQDDGPGFSNDSLNAFGKRRVTRMLEKSPGGRLSVGLGSVVMRTICEVHKGKIEVSNEVKNGQILGARVEITLPA